MSEPKDAERQALAGFFFALSAYGVWGFLPLFWRLLDHINPLEVVIHRAIWSVPVALAVLLVTGRTGDIRRVTANPRHLLTLSIAALLITGNWGLFVWAISVDRTVETALGYYINPLLTVALGAIFLREQLTAMQAAAVALASLAVLLLTIAGGIFPWISLLLAFTFAIYGFIRKTIDVGPTQGFLVEAVLASILSIPFIIWFYSSNQVNFAASGKDTILLMLCGPATAVPLILYAQAAKRLRLATIGIMQYIAPTIIFLIGVFVFLEPFGGWKAITFILIWLALALYSWSMWSQNRKATRPR